jgi:hypothetical protein
VCRCSFKISRLLCPPQPDARAGASDERRLESCYPIDMGNSNEIDVTRAVEIDRALEIVRGTLDLLLSRGQETAAFEVARAQFRASVRASWPGNVSSLVGLLANVEQDAASKLDEAERAELRGAMDLLRKIAHP